MDVLVPSLASQRGCSWRRVARDSLNLAFTNQRVGATTEEQEKGAKKGGEMVGAEEAGESGRTTDEEAE